MYIWLVEALSLILHKANFFLQQRNIFYLTRKFVEINEKVPPTQTQINNYNPTNSLSKTDEIKSII